MPDPLNKSKPTAAVSALGVCCPKCGGRRLRALFTRYRTGAVVRVRQCAAEGCGHRIRTVEKVESLSG